MRSRKYCSGLHQILALYHAIRRAVYTASAERARHSSSWDLGPVADTITPRINLTVIAGVLPTRTLSLPVTWHRCY
jgi:hypothetical protein